MVIFPLSVLSHPKHLSIHDFIYHLPDESIAKFPLENRDEAALLVYRDGDIRKDIFNKLDEQLPSNSLLIFNDSKVIHARILFRISESIQIECFCLEPADGMAAADSLSQHGPLRWTCMVGMARKWKSEKIAKPFSGKDGDGIFTASKISNEGRDYLIEFDWDNKKYSFSEVLELVGDLPIPPYLNRAPQPEDEQRYNTVYAGAEGSVAAPTAGLHFTKSMLEKLKGSGKELGYVTLHVGAGTFLPVKSSTMEGHEMHAERIDVSVETIAQLANALGKKAIVTVGTTSTRTIESLYWLGIKWMKEGRGEDVFFVNQWEPYEYNVDELPSSAMVFSFLEKWMKENQLESLSGYTRLMIAPGYTFQVVDALITNFHQPGSTLLLLVAALVGDDWKRFMSSHHKIISAFLSFGDSSLLFK
ncbi:MAG: S-adenosylmethionine:tRNA ribosyltransferase-isomerase [Bacteroidetes bacterium]|nr:S-adenosylmethionine:tRNA ribosyltransferase-isomerase [Bacteroidota bacterium]